MSLTPRSFTQKLEFPEARIDDAPSTPRYDFENSITRMDKMEGQIAVDVAPSINTEVYVTSPSILKKASASEKKIDKPLISIEIDPEEHHDAPTTTISIAPKPTPSKPSSKKLILPSLHFKNIRENARSYLKKKLHRKQDDNSFISKAKDSLWHCFKWCLPKNKRNIEKLKGKRKPLQYSEMSPAQQRSLKSFLIDLGYALSIYGTPAHRVEYHLTLVATYFGLEGYYYSTPTGLFLSFGDNVHGDKNVSLEENHVHLVRINSTTFDLLKKCMIDDVADGLIRGKYQTIDAAKQEIEKIIEMPSLHYVWLFISLLFSSIGFAVLLEASFSEVFACAISGFFIGILAVLARKVQLVANTFFMLAALVGCACGTGVKALVFWLRPNYPDLYYQRVDAFVVALAGIISLVPGYTFTTAVGELSYWHLITGTVKILEGLLSVLQIGFGLILGYKISSLIPIPTSPDVQVHDPFPLYVHLAVVIVVISCFVLKLRVPKYPLLLFAVYFSALLSFIVSKVISMYVKDMGDFIGSFAGALIIGLIGNIYARISDHPSEIATTAPVLFLFPGSFGITGINSFIAKDVVTAVDFVFKVFMVSLAIAVGLLLSGHIISGRKKIQK